MTHLSSADQQTHSAESDDFPSRLKEALARKVFAVLQENAVSLILSFANT
jgi:hypothetical protein